MALPRARWSPPGRLPPGGIFLGVCKMRKLTMNQMIVVKHALDHGVVEVCGRLSRAAAGIPERIDFERWLVVSHKRGRAVVQVNNKEEVEGLIARGGYSKRGKKIIDGRSQPTKRKSVRAGRGAEDAGRDAGH